MMRKSNGLLALALLLAVGCKTTSSNSTGSGPPGTSTCGIGFSGLFCDGDQSSRWTDSVLASMTLREKAAQIVWPSVLGDYASGDSPLNKLLNLS